MSSLKYVIAIVLSLLIASPILALAASPEPTATPSVEVTATPSVEPTVSPSPLPPVSVGDSDLSTEKIPWLAKLSLFLTFKKDAKYYQKRLRLANSYLLASQKAAQAGQADKAASLLDAYNVELQKVQQYVTQSGTTSTDPAVIKLQDQLLADNTLHLVSLDSLTQLKLAGQFNSKITAERLAVAQKMAQILAKDQDPEKLDQKITQLSDKLASKDKKASDKYQRKLGFIDDLSKAAALDESATNLQQTLDDQEETQLEKASTDLDDDDLTKVAEHASDEDHRITVLTRVLANAPAAAQPALTKVLAKLQARATTETTEDNNDDSTPTPKPSPSGAKHKEKSKEKTEKKSSPSPKSSANVSVNESHSESGNSSSKTTTNINVTTDDGAMEVHTDNESGKTPSAEFGVTVTASSCGSALTTSAGTNVKINVTNTTTAEITYAVSGYGSISVKPSSKTSLAFTAGKAGTASISCSNGQTSQLTIK